MKLRKTLFVILFVISISSSTPAVAEKNYASNLESSYTWTFLDIGINESIDQFTLKDSNLQRAQPKAQLKLVFNASLENVDVTAAEYNPNKYYMETINGTPINLDMSNPFQISFFYVLKYNKPGNSGSQTGFIPLINEKTKIDSSGSTDLIDSYKQQINDTPSAKILVNTANEFRFRIDSANFESAIDPRTGVLLEEISRSSDTGLYYHIILNGYGTSSADNSSLSFWSVSLLSIAIIPIIQVSKRKERQ